MFRSSRKLLFLGAVAVTVCVLGAFGAAQNVQQKAQSVLTVDDFNQFSWRWVGPMAFAGRVSGFAVPRGQSQTYYALMASGGVRTAEDALKAIALGADGVILGTVELVAIDCVRCCNCERGRGCPIGIATTDPQLSAMYDATWGSQRIMNLFHSCALQLQDILHRFGMKSVRELVGRSDLLLHRDYEKRAEYRRVESG